MFASFFKLLFILFFIFLFLVFVVIVEVVDMPGNYKAAGLFVFLTLFFGSGGGSKK